MVKTHRPKCADCGNYEALCECGQTEGTPHDLDCPNCGNNYCDLWEYLAHNSYPE